MQTQVRIALLVWFFAGAAPHQVCAADFLVNSKVYVQDQKSPHSTNVTLFQGAHVYDFLDKPLQIALYDLKGGGILLMDPERRLKVEVSRTMLDAYCNNLLHLDTKTDDPLLRFALRPAFQESTGNSAKRVFSSKHLKYEVTTSFEPAPGTAASYRAFSDASARLNSLINRGSLPPFARMAVNESLAQAPVVPLRIRVTISPRPGLARAHVLRSEHTFISSLPTAELQRIEEADALASEARQVSLSQFLRTPAKEDE